MKNLKIVPKINVSKLLMSKKQFAKIILKTNMKTKKKKKLITNTKNCLILILKHCVDIKTK